MEAGVGLGLVLGLGAVRGLVLVLLLELGLVVGRVFRLMLPFPLVVVPLVVRWVWCLVNALVGPVVVILLLARLVLLLRVPVVVPLVEALVVPRTGLTTLDRMIPAMFLDVAWNRCSVWLTACFTFGSPLGLNSRNVNRTTSMSLRLLTLNMHVLHGAVCLVYALGVMAPQLSTPSRFLMFRRLSMCSMPGRGPAMVNAMLVLVSCAVVFISMLTFAELTQVIRVRLMETLVGARLRMVLSVLWSLPVPEMLILFAMAMADVLVLAAAPTERLTPLFPFHLVLVAALAVVLESATDRSPEAMKSPTLYALLGLILSVPPQVLAVPLALLVLLQTTLRPV